MKVSLTKEEAEAAKTACEFWKDELAAVNASEDAREVLLRRVIIKLERALEEKR